MNRSSLVLILVLLVILLGIFSTGCSGLASTTTAGPVATAPSITAQPTSQSVTAGQTASFSVAATGTAPLNYQWKKNGVAVYGASSPAYSTPTTNSSDNGEQFTVVVSNSAGSVTSSAAILTVNASIPPLQITSSQLPGGTAGSAYTATLSASGGTSPYSWSVSSGTLPTGLSLSSSGAISGTPTVAGAFPFTVAVKDAASASISASLSITVVGLPPLQITTSQLPGGTVGTAYSAMLSASGGTSPYSWSVSSGTLPAGLSLSASGTLSGTPTVAGSFPFTVAVKDANSTSASASLNIIVVGLPPLQITTSQLPGGTVGSAYSATLSASGGTSPYSWSVSGGTLPTGLSLSSSGTLSGTPTVAGAFPFTVAVKDAASGSASANLSLPVVGLPPLQITSSQLPGGTVGNAYNATLSASGGTSPYSWSVSSGTLPAGLSLSSSGTLSGTATVAGTFPFTVAVKDAASASASASLSINVVAAAPPTVSISNPANGATVSGTTTVSGVASDGLAITSVQLSIDGGAFANASGTTSWSFSLNTNSLSNGSHTLSAKVNDSSGNSATSSPVSITVNNGSTTATDCTLFASPSGSSSNSGTSASSPKSFSSAAAASGPGSVVCLLGGTYSLSSSFSPPTSGSPSSWITYKNYDSTPVNFVWTGGSNASAMFYIGGGSFPSGPAYLQFQGLNLNGNANAADGFFCRGSHHLRFLNNSISNTGGSGIASIDCDYLTSDHNLISHNGYIPAGTANPQWYSWTSAISYNSNQWFDNYPGFHNIISNNIISGEIDQSTNQTDGNGIILDLSSGSYDPATANTPPALIINNVVYGNGGRCIVAYVVTNFWIVNNTCFNNDLDTSENGFGSIEPSDSHNGYIINNIAVAYTGGHPPYEQSGTVTSTLYYSDLFFGAANNFSYSDPSQFLQANPLFLNPPSLGAGGYANALAPSLLSTGLTLLPTSPAYNRGIDPSTLSGLPANIVSDLKKYIYTDINGKARPQGGGVDLGAYQH
jgi:hypothetical protein